MLNITENKVHCEADLTGLKTQELDRLAGKHLTVRNLLIILLVLFVGSMLLPWTQNIQADGLVTTLRPEQRPQTIQATFSGRIERWYVTEGQSVRRGDTIVHLSEIKTDYFDPEIVDRVGRQVEAKEGSIDAYGNKAEALDTQIAAMERELRNKIEQIRNKIIQGRLKVQSDSADLVQARVDLQVAQRQIEAAQVMYEKGLYSLTQLEARKLKKQEAEAKLVAAENKLLTSKNMLENYEIELPLTQNEYANKIAKTQSDRFSTLSDQFDAQATVNKLRIERENYARRMTFYYIIAPQDGYVVKAITPGIGEIIKEGDPVVSIQPADYQLAVELYIRPVDLPLMRIGKQVRFLFDGWPAFFFSGWPGVSTGTFAGRVVAIDRDISENGKFRILVAPDPEEQAWPEALQMGGGAKGIALLNTVPLWYELWRVLNGFPPDLYEPKKSPSAKKNDGLVPKAPIKSAK
ncbi:MAG: HlyD family efflux transporter periplasmic adaptor subunit [Saprospiraceae bacterium]|nr:HlyD family efflux transporter periplasmic adaptor subunit [Saprospiraceae bacterium]